jgi:hypothetical protein
MASFNRCARDGPSQISRLKRLAPQFRNHTMPTNSIDVLLRQLDADKTTFDDRARGRVEKTLEKLRGTVFTDVDSLVRFHELLLFVRAHPHNSRVMRLADRLLSSFADRVELLRRSGADLTPLDYIEYSGIAGTAVTGHFSYDIAAWLVSRFPGSVEVDWSRHERGERLGSTLPRFLPLLEEESLVEANIPYLRWINSGRARGESTLQWLLEGFESLSLSERQKAELYDSLELWIRWELARSGASRTRNIRKITDAYYHRGSMIQRRDVLLERELTRPLRLKKLSARDGLEAIDMLRATTTVRYRELYGITHGDPRSVRHVDVGRGVEIFIWGLPPERRLPLRAYHLGFTLKNGVPINYIEGITLCGKMEVGFNTFYTYRDGESAWVYAQVLRLLHQVGAAECFSIDPYQLGFNNEEAIESGAFWFYRKLGFRPTRPELADLMAREEKRISTRRGYRTGRAVLRKLSAGNVVYEVDPQRRGEWDQFQVRNLGLAVQRKMARDFGGNSSRMREESTRRVAAALGLRLGELGGPDRKALGDLALVFSLIPGLEIWPNEEKENVAKLIRAKMSADEADYSRLLQSHRRLRRAILRLAKS